MHFLACVKQKLTLQALFVSVFMQISFKWLAVSITDRVTTLIDDTYVTSSAKILHACVFNIPLQKKLKNTY